MTMRRFQRQKRKGFNCTALMIIEEHCMWQTILAAVACSAIGLLLAKFAWQAVQDLKDEG